MSNQDSGKLGCSGYLLAHSGFSGRTERELWATHSAHWLLWITRTNRNYTASYAWLQSLPQIRDQETDMQITIGIIPRTVQTKP